jgi:hypothetical protein
MRRGEVWLINLDPTLDAEIKKTRPAVIVNDDAIGVLPLAQERLIRKLGCLCGEDMRLITSALALVLSIER